MKKGGIVGKYHYLFLAAFISLLLVFPAFSVYADEAELANIRAAILEKGAQWEAAENPISQLPPEERAKRHGALVPQDLSQAPAPPLAPDTPPPGGAVPSSFSWRNNGGNFVTPVRDQGSCGSCFVFAPVAAMEAKALINFYKPGADINFSEQTVLSCVPPNGIYNNCQNGGYAADVTNFLMNYGTVREGCYAYTKTNGYCGYACSEYNPVYHNTSNYRISSWGYAGSSTSPNVATIKSYIYSYGPVSTWYKIYSDFYYYSSGIYSHSYGYYAGNHFVLIVGWDDTNNCFIVKNSWGSGWGEGGYFRIAYNQVSNYYNGENGSVQFGNWTQYFGDITTPAAPTVSGLLINGGISYTTSPNVTLSFATGGVPRQVRTSLGGAWSAWQTLPPGNTLNLSLGTANGLHNVFVQVKDFVGRISPAARASIMFDNTGPTGNVKINGGATTVLNNGGSTPVHLQLAMFDRNMSSNPQMRIKVGAPFTGDPDGAAPWKSYSPGDDSVTLSGTGAKTVYVQFKDDYGKKSPAYSAGITVSNNGTPWTAPSAASITGMGLSGYKTSPALTFTYDVSDPTVKARYLFTNSTGTTAWTSWGVPSISVNTVTKSLTVSGATGPRQVYIQLKDTGGAVSDPYCASFTLDPSAPAAAFNINNGAATVKYAGATTLLDLNILANDAATGLASMAIETGTTPTSWEAYNVYKSYALNTGGGSGTYMVYVWLMDNAGNVSVMKSASINVMP